MKIRERKREEREKMPFPCSYPEFPLCFSLLFFMPLLATLTPGTGCLPYGHTIICYPFLSILIMVKLHKFKWHCGLNYLYFIFIDIHVTGEKDLRKNPSQNFALSSTSTLNQMVSFLPTQHDLFLFDLHASLSRGSWFRSWKLFIPVLNFNLDPFMLSLKVPLLSAFLRHGFLNLLPEVSNNF